RSSAHRCRGRAPFPREELGGAANLFADNATEGFLQGFLCTLNMLTESFVEQSLVITAASALDLLSKPRKNVIVDSDGDAGFPASDRNHRATLCIAEIVFTSHGGPHIGFSRAPLPDALNQTHISPRQVYTTTMTRPRAFLPRVIQRSSKSEEGSSMVRARSSSRTVTASAKRTPCLAKFARALAGSHS